MRTSIRGTDSGNASLSALILIMVLSFVFVTIVPRINAVQRYAHEYRTKVISEIEETNREILGRYDLY